jgi:hypothetical protein
MNRPRLLNQVNTSHQPHNEEHDQERQRNQPAQVLDHVTAGLVVDFAAAVPVVEPVIEVITAAPLAQRRQPGAKANDKPTPGVKRSEQDQLHPFERRGERGDDTRVAV